MAENLVIVESPAKAKTIEKFLGKDFLVKSSFGHIRDLAKKEFGINIKKNYEPHYIISADKKKVVTELKKLAQESAKIWLASDEDREGEAISWHLAEVLGIPADKAQRIVFHEITKEAILKAIRNPRPIDQNLVNAQQARRVLDRLVGFELSPVLWKKVKPSLSAGRVQSVAVRLLVEREREVLNFNSIPVYRVVAVFEVDGQDGKITELKAELDRKFSTREETAAFLESCKSADFLVDGVETKPLKKSPAPPFTTSTLQQEASRKFGFSVSQTMSLAQKLYEAGKITYMRTDSVNLSDLALNTAKKKISSEFGEKYLKTRQYKTKSKGAQEAHEAIRPTYMEHHEIAGPANEKKLYELIWKRTIASQMSEALLEKTTVNIRISNRKELLVATGEVLLFDGFIRVYRESSDDENGENGSELIPPLTQGQALKMESIEAMQRFPHAPARYTEASLVKKLEELGIGRPSTYAPTISTIQTREYVVKEDRQGTIRDIDGLKLKNGKITGFTKNEKTGFEKSKLFPTDIGMVVNDFLTEHFGNIVDYNFTASIEAEFDSIADGKMVWYEMIHRFYKPFHEQVELTEKTSSRSSGERLLGNHPETGQPVLVKIGRYGPMAQIGEANNDIKPRFARLANGLLIETITLEEAIKLFALPRSVGEFEDSAITVGVGRFGPYIRHKSAFYSLKKGVDDPMTIDQDRAIKIITEKRTADLMRVIREFPEEPELKVLNGRFGPYISYQKKNFKIPKNQDPATLSLDACKALIAKSSSDKK
ncbi:MAG: type I DNA topoisomerase [Porphyromonadaceae bacterium]|nr:MAG: type I DNA topoisomerase [Porphyromonadaceae bacterium]